MPKNFEPYHHRTDHSFNLTEYYALKSVKLSDSYAVTFIQFENDKETDRFDMFFCESAKIPTIKHEVHKMEMGATGNRYSVFAHKPFDDVTLRLLEDDTCSIYKFIITQISNKFSSYQNVYKKDNKRLDCIIDIYDNAMRNKKMIVELGNCIITNYTTSTFNSSDTSTPYMYDINMSFDNITLEYFR